MRIAHLSDLHFGRHDADLIPGLAADIASQAPDLVVVSGDFTQVGSARQFAAARAFLDTLPAPVFAVPGNHDVPALNLPLRFADPYARYRRYISGDLEPFVERGGVALAGLKTSRRMRLRLNWSDGVIGRAQLAALKARFAAAAPDAVRVVVAHHPLLHPEEEMQLSQRRVKRADLALRSFAGMGVRLVLSGHFHMSYVRVHEEPGAVRQAEPSGPRRSGVAPILVAQASSTISTRLRGHPNAYNIVDIADGEIVIRLREWHGTHWLTREEPLASALP